MPSKHNTSYAQLTAKIAKLEKSNKKLKRANKKRNRDSDSDDSDSSWRDGSGSPGKLVINGTKRNQTNTCVNTYPSPNKATYNLDSNSILNENTWVLQNDKDVSNLNHNDTLQKPNGNAKIHSLR